MRECDHGKIAFHSQTSRGGLGFFLSLLTSS